MAEICGICSGSGRDPITGSGRCPACGGSGMDLSYRPSPPTGPATVRGGGRGDGTLLLGAFFLLCLFVLFVGYVVASEIFAHHFFGARYSSHSWVGSLSYAVASLVLTAAAARMWGFLPGTIVGLVPAMPLYLGTKGEVGFWFIALNGNDHLTNNVFASWVALIGMVALHTVTAWVVQPSVPFRAFLVRVGWTSTIPGLVANAVMAAIVVAAYWSVSVAVADF